MANQVDLVQMEAVFPKSYARCSQSYTRGSLAASVVTNQMHIMATITPPRSEGDDDVFFGINNGDDGVLKHGDNGSAIGLIEKHLMLWDDTFKRRVSALLHGGGTKCVRSDKLSQSGHATSAHWKEDPRPEDVRVTTSSSSWREVEPRTVKWWKKPYQRSILTSVMRRLA